MKRSLLKFWRRATVAPVAAAFAFLAVATAIRSIVDPQSIVVDDVIGWIVYVWAVMYGVGGLGILFGAGAAHTRFEAAGWVLFAGGAGLQAFAQGVTIARGHAPVFVTVWSVMVLVVFAGAALIRVRRLVRGEHLVWVQLHDSKGREIDGNKLKGIGALAMLPLLATNVDLSYILAAIGIIAAVGGAAVAFRKAKPDSAAVLVDASKDVVMIQRGVIEDLQRGLSDAKKATDETNRQLHEMKTLEFEVAQLRVEIRSLRNENDRLKAENRNLRERVKHLENGSSV